MTIESLSNCDSILHRYLKSMSDSESKIRFVRRTVQSASVLTRGELDKYIGMDAVKSIIGIGANEEKKLADLIESNVLLFIRNSNPSVANVSREELLKESMVVDAFRAVVVAWLIYVSLSLSFGRVREDAIRDAWNIRNNLEHSSFEYIRRLLMKNISAINAQMKRHTVDDVIDRMEKVIDRDAMGSQSVVANKEIYKRKIDPRLQQYWKKVKEAFRMKQEDVDARLDEIHRKYGDFSEAIADIKDGKGSEGIVPTEEKLLERDMAQLEYVALTRYGALAEKNLGEVSDKVTEVALSLARRRLEVGYPLRMMAWSRSKIFEEFKRKAWGELYDDAMLIAENGSFMAVVRRIQAKRPADLIDFYDDEELLVQSVVAVVARRALKSSDFEEVPGALEEAYHTIDVVFSREFWKREGQRLLWQLIRGDAYCCSPMLDFAYEKVVSLLERSEKLKRNRIAIQEQKRAEERVKFSYRLGRLVGKIINWFG